MPKQQNRLSRSLLAILALAVGAFIGFVIGIAYIDHAIGQMVRYSAPDSLTDVHPINYEALTVEPLDGLPAKLNRLQPAHNFEQDTAKERVLYTAHQINQP